MKTLFNYLKAGSFGAVVLSLLFFSSCKEDEPEVNPLVGTYVLTQAYFTGQVTDGTTTTEQNPIVFLNFPDGMGGKSDVEVPAGEAGADFATSVLGGAIVDVPDGVQFDCSEANTRIDLRADGKFFITCTTGSDEVEQGTWTEFNNSLTLFISNIGTQVVIDDYTLSGNTLTGTIASLPLPKDFDLAPPPLDRLQFLETVVTFTKD